MSGSPNRTLTASEHLALKAAVVAQIHVLDVQMKLFG